jgi:tRNA U34 5-carboxymethylaminomethyl modifying GTPase MnmE/TrmE
VLNLLAKDPPEGPPEVQEAIASLRALQDVQPERLCIANAGLLKAGKSSVFNALVDQDGYFPTGAARTTVTSHSYTIQECEFVDTPGLDAKSSDTAAAEHVHRQCDLVLFVHSVQNGEFDAIEVEFMKQLREWYPAPGHQQRALIPVYSKIDYLPNDRELCSVLDRCRSQWQAVFGNHASMGHAISASRYMKGVSERRKRMAELSGIPELRAEIKSRKSTLLRAKHLLLCERVGKSCETLRTALADAIAALRQAEVERLTKAHEVRDRILRETQSVYAAIDQRYDEYKMKYLGADEQD